MKKRMILWAALILGMAMLVQGCSAQEKLQYFTQEEASQSESRPYEPEIHSESENAQESESQQNKEQTKPKLKKVSDIYYAYHKLEPDEQQVYQEILDALTNLETGTKVSTLDKTVLDRIFTCVMNDHPELFYVEGYQYTEYTYGSSITSLTFSGTYSMSDAEVDYYKLLIEQKVKECFTHVPLNEDEYSTVKYLYEWLISNTEYDKNVQDNQNICSVFLQGKSVCQGYAKAMQYMLQRADIPCLLLTGFTNGERHAWNLVKVDGDYYYLDPTWGDASYAYHGAASAEQGFAPVINYDYFLVTEDEMTRTHSFEKVVELPKCTATEDNYFVREGLLFTAYDEQQLTQIFESDEAKEKDYVTIKCADAESYQQMLSTLIDSQKIFDFIDRQGASISYTANEEQRIISFWNIY